MFRLLKAFASAIGVSARAFVALVGVAGITVAIANYTVTQGSGTDFGSRVISTVHYAQQLICDATLGTSCAAVVPGNTATVGMTAIAVTDPNVLAAINSSIPAGAADIGNAGQIFPLSAIPVSASTVGTATSIGVVLTATSGVTNYVCGFSIRANATAAATGNSTLTGLSPAAMNFTQWTAPLASGLGITEMIFTPCMPASASNTAITLTPASPGSGGTFSASIWGYRK